MLSMDNKEIHIGKALLKILDLVIIKPLTLPYRVYHNALISLSNTSADDSEESNLSDDFPLYVWFVSIFNAIIGISYPVGLIIAFYLAFDSSNGFSVFVGILIATYFFPLYLGLFREFAQIILKTLLYLKIISKHTRPKEAKNNSNTSSHIEPSCSQCGNPTNEEDTFCENCGNKLK
jgi:hypothetical protein